MVDEHPIARRGLQAMLTSDHSITICGETGTAAEVESLIQSVHPDVIAVDLMSGRMPGIALTHQLKNSDSAPGVLIVTGVPAQLVLLPALEAGADGYINKSRPAEDYVRAVHTVSAHQLFLCPCAQRQLVRAVVDREPLRDRWLLEALSTLERDVLEATAAGYGTDEIAARLHLGNASIGHLRTSVRLKLGLRRRSDLVDFALRVGLLSTDSHV
ncbi:MAG TPA: response regulator transcription factor [Longimicrobiales bacterium]|nr:response regulator transcription factor [Longimicrobiales bacterium]